MSHSFPGMDDITRIELANGIVVLSRLNPNSPSVVINGYVHTGSLFDPDEFLGLADFTSAALLRGSARHNFQETYDLLESAGASLRFSSGTHTTAFTGQSLAEDIYILLDLLAEALRDPVFPMDEIERLRGQLLSDLAIQAQDTASMAQRAFDHIIYVGHPYSRPEEGVTETIAAIKQQDIAAFHHQTYGPAGMVLAIVGAVNPSQAVALASQLLGDWHNPGQPMVQKLPPVTPLESVQQKNVCIPGKAQADLLMGVAGPSRRSPDFVPASLGNSILGQFGMMGRVGEAVREKAGLAYYVQSSLSGGPGPGPWDIAAGVDPQNVERTIELIRSEIRRFVSEPVSREELADVQAQFTGSLPLSLESNHGVAAALVNLERYQLGLDYYRGYRAMIEAVTREDVLQAAQRYLNPDRLGIGIAGP